MTPDEGRDVRLSWIVVGHESARDLGLLLPSLVPALEALGQRGFPCELLVVDNACCDESAAVVRRVAPGARYVRCATNRGFGAAANRGAELARGPWLAISNADLYVPRGGLDALPGVLSRAEEDVALVGPGLLEPDGQPSPSAGRFPSLLGLLLGLLRPGHERKYLTVHEHRRGEVDWVTGACLFARGDVFRAAGGFDEAFFLYYEDVDLARRLRARGHRVLLDPAASVVHVRPHHGRPPRLHIEEVVRASRQVYFARHRPGWEVALLRLLGRAEPVLRRRTRQAAALAPLAAAPAPGRRDEGGHPVRAPMAPGDPG